MNYKTMFTKFERLLAFRYLKARKKEGFLSLTAAFAFTGIMLGVATLIIVMSVMNGFRSDLLERILGFGGHIEILGDPKRGIEKYPDLLGSIRKHPEVTIITPLISAQAMVTHNGKANGAKINGISYDDLLKRDIISHNIVLGALEDFAKQDNTILIGIRMANKLGVLPGHSLTLISPQGNATAFGTMPRMKRFTIAGIFKVGMSQYDENVIFMNLKGAQIFFQLNQSINAIEIFTKNPNHVTKIREEIAQDYGHNYDISIYDWMQNNSPFFGAVQVERNVMFIILTLIILIAAFNIISTLVMLVKNKSKDIAIIRTMGATRLTVTKIFFLAGASISIAGTALGVLIGLLFCYNIESIRQGIQKLLGFELFNEEIYFLSQLPAKVDFHEVGVVVTMSLTISFIFSVFPALRAARLDPVEALRYE